MVAPLRRKERAIGASSSNAPPAPGFLRAQNLAKRFGPVVAVDEVSLEVGRGEFICILGPSGCGKTTLLRLIAGLESASGGRLLLDGRDITHALPARRHCGIVFQSYALFPNLTAFQNVAYGLRRLSRGERDRRVEQWLEWVGLSHCANRRPSQLSGGQQQRVALARALAPEPSLLLLDEPLSALDAKVRHQLRTQIKELQRRLGITTIMVTHDQLEAMTMAERIVVMRDGRVLQTGTPSDLYHRPVDPFVADFLGSMNFLPAKVGPESGVICGGRQLVLAQNPPGAPGDDVILAIRPEDIQATGKASANCLPARMQDQEFRGSHYRIRATVEAGDSNAPPIALELEVQGQEAGRVQAEIGEAIELHLPPDRLLAFKSEGG